MGFVKNILIQKTEEAMTHLSIDQSSDHLTEKEMEDDALFDNIESFIMDNGDMIRDTPLVIAEAYKKHIKGAEAQKIQWPENFRSK